MTITQTVEIPADRRITVPREVPTGPVILTFTPITKADPVEFSDATTNEALTSAENILDKHLFAFKELAK